MKVSEMIAEQLNGNINERTWGDILINVKVYGARGDGVSDDTISIQQAVDYVNLNGGKVYFPPGTYKITSPIRIFGNNLKFEGSGIGATVIKNYSNTDAIILTDSWQKLQITICDLTIDSSGLSSGTGINMVNVNRSIIQNVQVKNHFNLLCFGDSCFDVYTSNLSLIGVKQYGAAILIDGKVNGGGIWVSDCTIDCGYDGTSVHDGTDGIRILSSSGNYLSNIDIRNAGQDGVHINPTGGSNVLYHWLTNVLGDTSKRHGIHIDCGVGSLVYAMQFNGCWASTNSSNGLVIEGAGTIDGVDSVNFRAYDNNYSGIHLVSGKNINIVGGSIAGNSGISANTYAGVIVDAGVSEFGFDSVRVGPTAGRPARQPIGIQIMTGASDNYKITDCDVRGNTFAGIDDNGTGTNKVVRDNIGYKTESGGTFTANGTGVVTVFNIPHGLVKVPSIYTVTAGSTAAKTDFFITADATNIVVTFGTAPISGTDNILLRWDARL